MELKMDNLEITHNEGEKRFETWIDGKLSKLDYNLHGHTIVMMHVGVHPEHRGQGIAGKLTKVGLEYAKEKNLHVIPMCSYVAAYIHKHPEYAPLTKQQAIE
jgi:predicted GNAT family acetyltransferase